MREIIHRVDTPVVSCSLVMGPFDAVNQRVSHVQIGMGHVDLGPEDTVTVGMFSCTHLPEQCEVLFHTSVPIWAIGSRRSGRAFLGGHVFGTLMVNVSLARLDQLDGKGIKTFKMITGVEFAAVPLIAQPRNIFAYRIHILLALLFGVCVVEAQVHKALMLFGQTKGQANGFGMPDVQMAIWLRRKARVDLLVLSGIEVCRDDVLDKVLGRRGVFCVLGVIR